ncbi:IS1595 family transposase [Gelidibacter japonicus]|uniref:IS1595 family transposase n=1 Tax=Gelidibacter japonicus TaxID=1962232 RepID=UPI0013D8AF68|nr:IS1595 family transposase [Gelidibacter japonicus]
MEIEKLKEKLLSLPVAERERLLKEIEDSTKNIDLSSIASRRHEFNNKLGVCPHCSHAKYVRFGKDKGAQRYKCKSCQRSFTEYTGTWMAGLQRKDKISDYLRLMVQEKSLDKIVLALGINKKTAFDWRHKILASLGGDDGDNFTGTTESDEAFFLRSEKGMEVKDRKPRKRGGKSTRRGISNDQVAVIVTQDRKSGLDLSVATLGRIGKADIANAIGKRIKKGATILCSDSHHSYKGFAKDVQVEFHPINVSKGQRVKGAFHVQHVNSTHNRIKKWIGSTFWGVSTKYLQQYLNWHALKEKIKSDKDTLAAFAQQTLGVGALKRFAEIQPNYEKLIATQC